MARDPAHARDVPEDMPRLVVLGTASWISDDSLEGRGGATRVALFNACVSWLRGKAPTTRTDVPDKTRQEYELNIPPDNTTRLKWLPLGLMVMIVIALGT